jgi:hypothetical protein
MYDDYLIKHKELFNENVSNKLELRVRMIYECFAGILRITT